MAPEQIDDATGVDERADLYAVGVVAFEALTGELPFLGRSTLEIEQFKKRRRAQTLAMRMGDAWSEDLVPIDTVLSRLLARPARERYATAAEALSDWRSASVRLVEFQPRTRPFA